MEKECGESAKPEKKFGDTQNCPSHSNESVERSHLTKDASKEFDVLNDSNDSSIVQRQRQIFYHPQKDIVSHHLNKNMRVVGSVNYVIYYSTLTVQLRQFGSLVMSHLLSRRKGCASLCHISHIPLSLNNISCYKA